MKDRVIIVWGIVLATLVALAATTILVVATGTSDEASDPPCYSLVDRVGNVYYSYYPPLAAADLPGTYTYNDDHEWGWVFGAAALRVDRDCLRERGVPVPPLKPRDEAP